MTVARWENRKYKWVSQNSHWDVKYSMGNIVNNVKTMSVVTWELDVSVGKLLKIHNGLTTML